MGRLQWDLYGRRLYHTGVDQCVVYPFNPLTNDYGTGVAWNGITNITESDSGYQPTPIWADNIKYLVLMSVPNFEFSIECYQVPKEFDPCDGIVSIGGLSLTMQGRKQFALAYRTLVGNDQYSHDYGYQLHLTWGCIASPSEKNSNTLSDSPSAETRTYSVTTQTISLAGYKPFCTLVLDSRLIMPSRLRLVEEVIYGHGDDQPRMITPEEVMGLLTIGPVAISAADPDSVVGHAEVSSVQDSIVVTSSGITGTSFGLNWLWDPFSFEVGDTTGQRHYLALDFSANDFSLLTGCRAGVRSESMVDVFNDEDHVILLEFDDDHTTLTVVQEALNDSLVETFDLSGVTRS